MNEELLYELSPDKLEEVYEETIASIEDAMARGFRKGARAGLLRGRKRATEQFTPLIAGNKNVFCKAVSASQQRTDQTDRRDFFPPV